MSNEASPRNSCGPSRQALALLKHDLVHVAGLHLGHDQQNGNHAVVKAEFGKGYRLVRGAEWEEHVDP